MSSEAEEHHHDEAEAEAVSLLDSVMEKVKDKVDHSSSSSSDSDSDHDDRPHEILPSVNRLFGRQKPVHTLVGGGKTADVLLWRNKQVSASLFVGATILWLLFEYFGYRLLTVICYTAILGITLLFMWSSVSTFINKQPTSIPKIVLSEEVFQALASGITCEINRIFFLIHDVASGGNLKKFIVVMLSLWIVSIMGSWTNFLSLLYFAFVIAHTFPVLYEKYEDHVDAVAFKALDEGKKHYRTLDANVLSKIPRGPFKEKKV